MIRLAVFSASGLFTDTSLLTTAIALAPACFAGVVLGPKLQPRFEPQTLRELILQLLLAGGSL